jgi:archaemetzincin
MDPEGEFIRLEEPRPGQWRYYFKEPPQDLEKYQKEVRNLKSPQHNIIYIQPLGKLSPFAERVLPAICEYVKIFFDCDSQLLKPLSLPLKAYSSWRNQYNATMLLEHLKPLLPTDAVAYTGITEVDLFSEGLNFVFGEASLLDRLGVYSLKRLLCRDQTLFLRRVIKLVSHEIAHIFSITHCVFYRCLMNGSNSLAEADARPLYLCPIDLEKLRWNVGFDVVERYNLLLGFYRRHHLQEDANWIQARLKRLSY